MIDSPRGAKSFVSSNHLKSNNWKLVEINVLLKTPLKIREPIKITSERRMPQKLQVPPTILQHILGDPGAVSGGGKKSKRARKKIRVQKSQERPFLHPNFFSRPFRLFPAPTNCPWVSEDDYSMAWHNYSCVRMT